MVVYRCRSSLQSVGVILMKIDDQLVDLVLTLGINASFHSWPVIAVGNYVGIDGILFVISNA